MFGIGRLVGVEMVSQHKHQIILQQPVCTVTHSLVLGVTRTSTVSILGEFGLLCQVNQVSFALLLQPRMRHGE
jgi:hypothetical protein